MVEQLKNIKYAYIILSLIFIIGGICMIVFPTFFVSAICLIAGAVFIIHGIARLIGYFSNDLYNIVFEFDFSLGIASILIGIIIILLYDKLVISVSVILGIITMISGTFKLQSALDARRFGISRWWLMVVGAIISVLFGLFLIVCPYESILISVRLFGAALVVDGIQNTFLLIYAVKYKNK